MRVSDEVVFLFIVRLLRLKPFWAIQIFPASGSESKLNAGIKLSVYFYRTIVICYKEILT
jgi:hypothetical protein